MELRRILRVIGMVVEKERGGRKFLPYSSALYVRALQNTHYAPSFFSFLRARLRAAMRLRLIFTEGFS
jgi:hypothetical protein